jgi:nucleotide-binding universal stress UspA family protein
MEESHSEQRRHMPYNASTRWRNCEVVCVSVEHRYRAIIDAANKNSCDLVVMASRGTFGRGPRL